MMQQDLFDYVIREFNKRFDRIESKVDDLIQFKWQIIGGSVIMSMILTGAIQLAIILIK